jgi:hypothetical protein
MNAKKIVAMACFWCILGLDAADSGKALTINPNPPGEGVLV